MADGQERRRFGCDEWGCVAALLAGLVLFLLPIFVKRNDHPRQPTCYTHLRMLANAVAMYAQDWDERFPSTLTWAPATEPYLGQWARRLPKVHHCPLDMRLVNEPRDRRPPSYAMITRWSLHALTPQDHPDEMVVLCEVGPGAPAYRHNEGMNLGFGDGHAKWVSRREMPPARLATGKYRPSLLKPAPR